MTASAIVALALTACGPPEASAPAQEPQQAAGAEPAIAAVHRSRCAKCHVRVEPRTRTRPVFEAALSRHRKRVRLTEEQWTELIDYLAPIDP